MHLIEELFYCIGATAGFVLWLVYAAISTVLSWVPGLLWFVTTWTASISWFALQTVGLGLYHLPGFVWFVLSHTVCCLWQVASCAVSACFDGLTTHAGYVCFSILTVSLHLLVL